MESTLLFVRITKSDGKKECQFFSYLMIEFFIEEGIIVAVIVLGFKNFKNTRNRFQYYNYYDFPNC